MQTKNPSRKKNNPGWRTVSKVSAPEHPATGATSGNSTTIFNLDVAVQIAADAGDLSFFDSSVVDSQNTQAMASHTDVGGDSLELFLRNIAITSVQRLSHGLQPTPATDTSMVASSSAPDGVITVIPRAQTILASRDAHAVTIRLVSSAEMSELNHAYRGKAGPTNVLSFAAFDGPDDEAPAVAALMAAEVSDGQVAETGGTGPCWQVELGDIAICTDIVGQEAQSQQKPALAHLAHMVVHGILHLMGYDHESEQEAGIMEATETVILRHLGFKNPYT